MIGVDGLKLGEGRLGSMGIDRLLRLARERGVAVAVEMPDGSVRESGASAPDFRLIIRNGGGLRALLAMDELPMSEAYVRGDIDFEGDLVRVMTVLRSGFSDTSPALKLWRRVHPLLVGREKLNPQWIAKHYDAKNIQHYSMDREWFTYTPGLYEDEGESMEVGAERKLAFAFDKLRLRAGDALLEVGCGWGGMTRYSARRGVRVTGITLSRDQLAFTEERIHEERLDARACYQDFFTYEPEARFDAVSLMGVIEDLSDYPRVMERLGKLLKPGGRAYFDFAAASQPFATSSFVTKYVWPGTFRMVYMPELVSAITHSPFEIEALWNDRRNYHLWAKKGHARWLESKDLVVAQSSIETFRLFRLLFAGTSAVMDSADYEVTAFRLLLELPKDAVGRPRPSVGAHVDGVLAGARLAKNAFRG